MTTPPMFGFVFINDDSEKNIFRREDAAKYFDETLTRISNTVAKLKGSDFVQTKPAEEIIRGINGQKGYQRVILQMYETLKNDFINPIDEFAR